MKPNPLHTLLPPCRQIPGCPSLQLRPDPPHHLHLRDPRAAPQRRHPAPARLWNHPVCRPFTPAGSWPWPCPRIADLLLCQVQRWRHVFFSVAWRVPGWMKDVGMFVSCCLAPSLLQYMESPPGTKYPIHPQTDYSPAPVRVPAECVDTCAVMNQLPRVLAVMKIWQVHEQQRYIYFFFFFFFIHFIHSADSLTHNFTRWNKSPQRTRYWFQRKSSRDIGE